MNGTTPRRAIAPLLGLALCLACTEEPRPPAPPRVDPPVATETSEPESPPEAPPEPEPPLPEARQITISAADGVGLVGDLRMGASPSAPLVILVHQLSSTRAEWEPLLRRLGVAPAMTTFAFDMRGHGASTQKRRREITWSSFEPADWRAAATDVLTVLAHLRNEEHLTPARVLLVGASIGSSEVIVAAAEEPSVSAVVALSPGRAYRGLDALTPCQQLGGRPLLAIAAEGEAASVETAENMARIASAGEAVTVDGRRHGVGMFEEAPDSLRRVVTFLRAQGEVPPSEEPAEEPEAAEAAPAE